MARVSCLRIGMMSWFFREIRMEWKHAGQTIAKDEKERLDNEKEDGLALSKRDKGGGKKSRHVIHSRYGLLRANYDKFLTSLGPLVPITHRGLREAAGIDTKSPALQDKSGQAILLLLLFVLRLKNPKHSRFSKILGVFQMTVAKTLSLKLWSRVRALPSTSLIYQQLKALSHGFADVAIVVHLVRTMCLLEPYPGPPEPSKSSPVEMCPPSVSKAQHADLVWAYFCSQTTLVQSMVSLCMV